MVFLLTVFIKKLKQILGVVLLPSLSSQEGSMFKWLIYLRRLNLYLHLVRTTWLLWFSEEPWKTFHTPTQPEIAVIVS